MKYLDLFIDLERRSLVAGADSSGRPKLPALVQGDAYEVRMHFLEAMGGAGSRGYREVRPVFDALKLGLGWIDRPPTSGSWRVVVDGDATGDLPHNIGKATLAGALNGLASVTALGGLSVEAGGAANIYVLRWSDAALASPPAVSVSENRLKPKAFSRVSVYETDAGFLHILKIMQAPVAFADAFSFPPPPAVSSVMARTGTGARNAVAALLVPDGAAGSLDLTWAGLTTLILPVESLSAGSLASALNGLWEDGEVRFAVSQPRRGVYYLEFVGPLGLAEQVPPTVSMHDQESLPWPSGSLDLNTPGIELALDGAAKVSDFLLEGELSLDGVAVTLFQQPVTVANDMIDAPMALASDPAWLEELRKPKATVDYDPNQAVIGMLGYQDFAGDGVADEWQYTHNLGTLNVHVTVRDNGSGRIVPDDEYDAEILNQNQVRITFPAIPALNQYVVVISSANADAHYKPHGHGMEEIDGLQAALAALSAAGNPLDLWPSIPLDKLPTIPASKIAAPLNDGHIPANIPRLDGEGFLPLAQIPPEVPRLLADGSLAVRSRATEAWTKLLGADGLLEAALLGDPARLPGFADAVRLILSGGGAEALAMPFYLPSFIELYPGRAPAPESPEVAAADLPRPSGLLPAVHDATVEDLTIPIPAAGAPYTGNVYLNVSGAEVLLPGGGGRRGVSLADGQTAACDGRVWYRVAREGASTSYHPTDFERELLLLDVSQEMLPDGAIFTLDLPLQLAVLRSEVRAQWVLLIESGSFTRVADPAGTNIAGISWSDSPMVSLPMHLTTVRTPHRAAIRISRSGSTLTTETKLYRGAWSLSDYGPSSPGFAIRARLARFDTEDGLADPRGYVLLAFNPTKTSIATIV